MGNHLLLWDEPYNDLCDFAIPRMHGRPNKILDSGRDVFVEKRVWG